MELVLRPHLSEEGPARTPDAVFLFVAEALEADALIGNDRRIENRGHDPSVSCLLADLAA